MSTDSKLPTDVKDYADIINSLDERQKEQALAMLIGFQAGIAIAGEKIDKSA